MKQKIIRYAVMIVALGVFIYSAYQLTLIYIESKESMEVYDEVKNMFISDASDQEIQTDEQGMTIANNNSGGQCKENHRDSGRKRLRSLCGGRMCA